MAKLINNKISWLHEATNFESIIKLHSLQAYRETDISSESSMELDFMDYDDPRSSTTLLVADTLTKESSDQPLPTLTESVAVQARSRPYYRSAGTNIVYFVNFTQMTAFLTLQGGGGGAIDHYDELHHSAGMRIIIVHKIM